MKKTRFSCLIPLSGMCIPLSGICNQLSGICNQLSGITNPRLLLLFLALGLVTTSCSDDEKFSEEEQQQQAEQQAETDLDQAAEFWNVVGQLTDDLMPDDWQHATYAPSIGEPDGGNTSVRIVSTGDAETAAARFAQLTGADVNEATQDYTYHSDAVGTLKYHRTGGTSFATVDVDIKQMPGLTQIIYQSPEQMGSNGSFNGTAYYRFGDVVKKINSDNSVDYWICVRPAFGPAGKGDSHWITVSNIPSANVKDVTKIINKQKVVHRLPKSLSTNREHMQNLAEMLYAMTNPTKWASNLATNDGYKTLKYFRDFNYKQLFKYNDDFFFGAIGNNWEARGLFKEIFGLNREQLKAELESTGLNLVYSSATMSGNKIVLPIATYYNTNLKTEVLTKSNTEWTTQFDIQEMLRRNRYIEYTDIAGHQLKGWLVRYATGATLCKGSNEKVVSDKYCCLTNCEDVFVCNRDVLNISLKKEHLKDIAPQSNEGGTVPTNAQNDAGTYQAGDVVKDQYGNRWFCLFESPFSSMYNMSTDRSAWFLSLDFNEVDINGNTVSGLPNEDDLPEVAYRIGHYLIFKCCDKSKYEFNLTMNSRMGVQQEHVRYYAGVDWYKIMVPRDSVWTFTSMNTEYQSSSLNCNFFLAYEDNSGKQAVARVVVDHTLSGNHRASCRAYDANGKLLGSLQDAYVHVYKHYQTYNPSKMRNFTDVEKALRMNTWCLPWVVSNQKMYLTDVTDQSLVNTYAHQDKWVTLPISRNTADQKRQQPRTRVEASAKPSDYIGHYDKPLEQQKLSMFNEPVLFLRVMKVTDNGGQVPNLTSQDNRKLTVVHLQNDPGLYTQPGGWITGYLGGCKSLITVDNVVTPVPSIPGLEILIHQ